MYLKSLELQGFKSFPDKTKLSFDEGTTVIVGPNGSGKSNLSDAMRWVLGEMSSKTLRGSKMEDFIFAGAAGRRPMGFAEVSVTFDNTGETDRLACPYDEVKVTRRYYRSGDSEYALNGQPARLKDIYELFMDTGVGRDGYSIIGQGRIGELISKKSDERRGVFEEAAGIAKYRFRKNEAERRLKSTEENMVRILDVFGEVESQVGPLEKEAERAKKALELMAVKKELDVRLWLFETEKQRTEVAEAETNFRRSEFDLKAAEEATEALEQQNERLLELSKNNKSTAEELLREIRSITSTIHALESERRVTETNIRHTEELLETAKASIRSIIAELAGEDRKRLDREAHTEMLRKKLESEQARKNAAENDRSLAQEEANRADASLGELLDALNDCETAISDTKLRLSILENAQKSGADRKESLESEIEDYKKTVSELDERYTSIRKKADGFEKMYESEQATVRLSEEKLASLTEKRDRTQESLATAKFEAGSIEQRIRTIRTMDEQFEGYSGSVRFVMKRYAEGQITLRDGRPCKRIYGPLSKIITVEDRYVTAIEQALGANLGHIVVEDDETAKAAMHFLKSAKAGRATFFPVSSMQPQSSTPEIDRAKGMKGFVALASDLITRDKKFDNVISNLLGRIVVFDTLENASEMAKACRYRVKAVTLDGQIINAGGSFTGGSTKTEGTILSRAAEVRRLEQELEKRQKKVGEINESLEKLRTEIADTQKSLNAASDKCRVVEILRNAELRRAEQAEAEKTAQESLLRKLEEDLAAIETQRTQAEEDSVSLSAELKALTERAAEIRLLRSEKDVARNEHLDRRTALEQALLEITLSVRDTEREIESDKERASEAEERITTLRAREAEEEEKLALYTSRIDEMNRRLLENGKESAEAQASLDTLNEKYAGNSADSLEYENRLAEINARIRRKTSEKEDLVRVHMKNENRLNALRDEQDKLSSQLWDEYELTRADALALGYPPLDPSERASATTERNSCRARLRAMGSVDLDAVEKYKELKERYDKMKKQIDDLQKTKNNLVKILDDLTVEMREAFENAFSEINTHFKRIFSELFGGGQAELLLSEPENPLESGIEIKAAPPGKVVKSLLQLSGGEQAFTAVALLFAILSVNPTPFCILDEIEAALDEANVERLAQYIKRYEGTQFIIITHRRGTMEAADNLYGVTMPEQGMSQVLRLSTDEIERYKEETPA
ncbi:MAG: chromosome segregation protein SMC [Clostridia bacterium]|nr:chromosome segregation protein SMC [Clostridia bacterium]